jgi:hypothetical protein
MLAAAVLEQQSDIDLRRAGLDQLAREALQLGGGQTQQSLTTMSRPVVETLRYLYNLADHLLVRSWTEYNYLAALFGRSRPAIARFAPLDPEVPEPSGETAKRDAIVIWAPRQSARDLSLFAFPFEEMDVPVIAVCNGDVPSPLRHVQFVAPDEGSKALARALVVIVAELCDPGTARALAAHGVPLAVSSTSGAHEYLDRVFVFEPWDWRAVFRATMAALGDGLPPVHAAPAAQRLGPPALPPATLPPNPPLVSVVTPTYNRRDRIARCLRRWSEDRYPNLEHVVVNDGGEPIDDLVAPYPHVRLVVLEKNVGPAAALNRGVEAARGEYLVLAADDDDYAPDHVVQLVAALERTGASVAHANTIIRHERLENDKYVTTGYSLYWNNPLERTIVLTEGVLALQSVMLRREAFANAGWYDPSLPHARDYGMITELAKRYDFVHVDTASLIYNLRVDASSERYKYRGNEAAALRMIYERNPAVGRPVIEASRQAIIANAERVGSSQFHDPILPLSR